MKKIFTICLMTIMAISAFAQTDTVYTRTEIIPCEVKEITETSVRFSYPNETLINTFSLNRIDKIVFRSGRVQTFTNLTSYKKITSPLQWEKVSLANTELEIQGLYKIGDVSSKAKGTTEFSNQERVKQRALDKIKIQAALLGANIIYLSHMRSDGNSTGFWEDNTSETSIMGIAYASELPDFEEVKDAISAKDKLLISDQTMTKLLISNQYWLGNSNANMKQMPGGYYFYVKDIRQENGLIIISGGITLDEENEYQVSYFNESSIYIANKSRRGIISYELKL